MFDISILSLHPPVLSETGPLLRSHQKGWERYRKVQQRAGESRMDQT